MRESVAGGGVFPWLNASVNAPAPQDGAGLDQAGRPVPAVYAVSRPQPLDGVITIVAATGAAASAVGDTHSAPADAASIESVSPSCGSSHVCPRIVCSSLAYSHESVRLNASSRGWNAPFTTTPV